MHGEAETTVTRAGQDSLRLQALNEDSGIQMREVRGGNGGVLVEHSDAADFMQAFLEDRGQLHHATLDLFRADFQELAEGGVHRI